MKYNILFAIALLCCCASNLSAQDWALKMFDVTSHDFGTVARGAKAEFEFTFKNLYEEELHIAGVRTSCGCTTPRITKQTLKSLESAAIVATYNTRSFYGAKSATITVVIDKPFVAEVQLTVNGYIRSDVVFDPGSVTFGTVQQGSLAERKVKVSYAGRADWSIADVRSTYAHVAVQLSEPERIGNRTSYDMLVQLLPDAPAGLINTELSVVTDDLSLSSFPLNIEATVVSPLTVSPATLTLGVVKPGQTVTKQLLVRAKEPFTITGVQCEDCIEAKVSPESKTLHIVPITFKAGSITGTVSHNIKIQTDLGEGLTTACEAKATIRETADSD
jgi:hypothetical protein